MATRNPFNIPVIPQLYGWNIPGTSMVNKVVNIDSLLENIQRQKALMDNLRSSAQYGYTSSNNDKYKSPDVFSAHTDLSCQYSNKAAENFLPMLPEVNNKCIQETKAQNLPPLKVAAVNFKAPLVAVTRREMFSAAHRLQWYF